MSIPTSRCIWFACGLLALGLVWIVLSIPGPEARAQAPVAAPRQGFLAPEAELFTGSGSPARLADYRGQVVVLNFWASWCSPCRQEMPALQRVYETYRERGLVVLAANSTGQDQAASANEFVRSLGLTFPILFDPHGAAARTYRVSALPTTYFIDPGGKIRAVAIGGPLSETYLRSLVEPLLMEVR